MPTWKWKFQGFGKYFLRLLILILLPLIIFNSVLSRWWIKSTLDTAYENDNSWIELVSLHADTVFESVIHSLGLLEGNHQLVRAIRNAEPNYLNMRAGDVLSLLERWKITSQTILAKPYILELYFYLEQHPDRVLTSQGIQTLSDISDTTWFEEYKNQEENVYTWITNLQPSKFGNTKESKGSLYIFRRWPYFNDSSKLNGIMAVQLDRAFFDSVFAKLPYSEDRQIIISDPKMGVIYKSKKNISDGQSSLDYSDITSSKAISTTKEKETISNVVASKFTNLTYTSILPSDIFFEKFKPAITLMVILILFELLVSILVATYLSYKNYKPIENVIHLINHYTKYKSFPSNLQYAKRDEFGYIINNLIRSWFEKSETESKYERQQLLFKEAQLIALQSQINPHFLYNTLEAINWEAIKSLGISNNVSKMLISLSQHLRYISVPSASTRLIDEVNNLSTYINLLEALYDQTNFFNISVDQGLLETIMPRMILQPLVENSVKHGFSDSGNLGKIYLKIERKNNLILIRVYDNGHGIPKEQLRNLNSFQFSSNDSKDTKLGLKNIHKRLVLNYPSDTDFRIISSKGRGTIVKIKFPVDHIESQIN